MSRQGGLGRGLASLIPQRKKTDIGEVNYFGSNKDDEGFDLEKRSPSPKRNTKRKTESGGKKSFGDISLKSIIEVETDKIVPNPFQPRKHFDEEKLQQLADSLKQHGLLQPIVVSRKSGDEYELIAGERRLEASKIAGLEKVPVIIKKATDQQKLELALIENIQRHNLNVIEEARAYKQLQEKFGLTQEEIALRSGKSRSSVANHLRLLNLPVEIQKALQEGRITEGHARTILAVSNPEKQRALFQLIIRENLSVRQIEDKVREVAVSSHKRKIKNTDPALEQQQQNLSEILGTKTKIRKNSKGGQIVIDFFSPDEFDSLYNKLISLE